MTAGVGVATSGLVKSTTADDWAHADDRQQAASTAPHETHNQKTKNTNENKNKELNKEPKKGEISRHSPSHIPRDPEAEEMVVRKLKKTSETVARTEAQSPHLADVRSLGARLAAAQKRVM